MAKSSLKTPWEARLSADRERAMRQQSPALQAITNEVVRAAEDAGGVAVALTGSTARGKRTAISDLDYHIVGPRLDARRFRSDVDIAADSLSRFQRRLTEGDDFVQWTLRYGCVLRDPQGIMRDAHERIESERLWPDPKRKFERADALADLAERVLAIQDRDAAQEHIRAAITSLARGVLLAGRTFPLARVELPDQLRAHEQYELAIWLGRSIDEALSLEELRDALNVLRNAGSLVPH